MNHVLNEERMEIYSLLTSVMGKLRRDVQFVKLFYDDLMDIRDKVVEAHYNEQKTDAEEYQQNPSPILEQENELELQKIMGRINYKARAYKDVKRQIERHNPHLAAPYIGVDLAKENTDKTVISESNVTLDELRKITRSLEANKADRGTDKDGNEGYIFILEPEITRPEKSDDGLLNAMAVGNRRSNTDFKWKG